MAHNTGVKIGLSVTLDLVPSNLHLIEDLVDSDIVAYVHTSGTSHDEIENLVDLGAGDAHQLYVLLKSATVRHASVIHFLIPVIGVKAHDLHWRRHPHIWGECEQTAEDLLMWIFAAKQKLVSLGVPSDQIKISYTFQDTYAD